MENSDLENENSDVDDPQAVHEIIEDRVSVTNVAPEEFVDNEVYRNFISFLFHLHRGKNFNLRIPDHSMRRLEGW